MKDIKICANCRFYTSYYTLANDKIYRVNDGFCSLCSKNQKNHTLMDSCDNYDAIKIDEGKCLDDISKKIYDININIEQLNDLLTTYRNNKKST